MDQLQEQTRVKARKYPFKKSYLWDAEKQADEVQRKLRVWRKARIAKGAPIKPVWWLK